jgi:hypothetical protein
MDTFDYTSNSHRSKIDQDKKPEERKKLEKVVKGTVTTKKKSGVFKLADSIFADNAKNVGSYLKDEVFIPSAKKLLVDLIKNGAETLFYGSVDRSRRGSVVDRVSYDSFSNSRRYEEPRQRVAFDYDQICINDRGEAEMVLARLDEVIDTYGWARVSDLYDLIGVTCDYTCNNYGWNNLSTARVVLARGGGYKFDLPRALPIHR